MSTAIWTPQAMADFHADTLARAAEEAVIASAKAVLAAVRSDTFPVPTTGASLIKHYEDWLADDLEARDDLLAGRRHPASEFPELARWWPHDALGQAVAKVTEDIAADTAWGRSLRIVRLAVLRRTKWLIQCWLPRLRPGSERGRQRDDQREVRGSCSVRTQNTAGATGRVPGRPAGYRQGQHRQRPLDKWQLQLTSTPTSRTVSAAVLPCLGAPSGPALHWPRPTLLDGLRVLRRRYSSPGACVR